MVAKKSSSVPSAETRKFWGKAFRAGARLLKPHDGKQLPPTGAAHWCADFADLAVAEYQRRFGGPQR